MVFAPVFAIPAAVLAGFAAGVFASVVADFEWYVIAAVLTAGAALGLGVGRFIWQDKGSK